MGLIGTIKLIWNILKNMPAIIGLIMEIIKIINSIKDSKARKAATKELRMALKAAKETGRADKIQVVYDKYVKQMPGRM